jgi:molybdopterin synthase sulfur carrier subunit
VKILYFAWLRQRVGHAEENVDLPAGVTTVAGLVDWLRGRGPGYAAAFANPALVRVAVNQEFARLDAPIKSSDEIGLFPPVTGG